MKQWFRYILLISIILISLDGIGQVLFVKNQGQWQGDFSYKVRLKYGALYFKDDGLRYHLANPADLNAIFGEDAHHSGHHDDRDITSHAWDQHFINAQTPSITSVDTVAYRHNYFLGKNPNNWRGDVPVFTSLNFENIYPGISINYYEADSKLKYNWIVKQGADAKSIKWNYPGADSVWIQENEIIIKSSVGYITEKLPKAYTLNNGIETNVKVSFKQEADYFTFDIDSYDHDETLVIDPVIVFASFSGSLADNWGFTATYDAEENLYGGGIVLASGYPTTTGAFQSNHANPTDPTQPFSPYGIDIGITKFNPQGNGLIYSTYIGGNSQDQPHSMFVDDAGDLYVFGVTGSSDFPVHQTGYDTLFSGGDSINLNGYDFGDGTDAFVVKLSPNGSSLLGGTYIGGTANDGLNRGIVRNYADQSRGEIVIGDDGDAYITASTFSTDFPIVNGTQGFGGKQEAFAMRLSSNLSSIVWSTFYGGVQDDAGYGIKVGTNGAVYITGSTEGSTLAGTAGSVGPSYLGGTHDGFIAQFNQTTGNLQAATYVGTNSYDQTFLLDLDKFNNVYVLGQTGGNYPVTPGKYSNNNAKQFIHKFNSGLTTSLFSTRFGRGSNTIDIVPIALNVDDCLNILLSGWGGETNDAYLGGRTLNMPLTPDAAQSTSDGSDLYFAVFGPNADSLKYATYFGGSSSREHVDGGTSRFDPRGNIYQAVCAGCGGYSDFPATPGAWSTTNNSQVPSNNCNLGVVKINFETSVEAGAIVDTNIAIDTNCNTLTLSLLNQSRNANSYFWDFGNGTSSTSINPTVSFDSLGVYTIRLIATDTICDISDSTELVIDHDRGTRPKARFATEYTSCDVFRTVRITNNTVKANKYLWQFGDGSSSAQQNPIYQYATQGVFTITLIAIDTTCGATDTTSETVDFTNNIPAPVVNIGPDSCFYGGINVSYGADSNWYEYEWDFGGVIEKSKYPTYRYRKAGRYTFSLTITDTICNTQYTFNFNEEVERIEDRVYIPNAFTPNRDLINEEFIIAGNKCIGNSQFQIFDSFGNLIFETDNPFGEFWDGYIDDKPAQEDVYVYYFKSDEFEKRGYITVFY